MLSWLAVSFAVMVSLGTAYLSIKSLKRSRQRVFDFTRQVELHTSEHPPILEHAPPGEFSDLLTEALNEDDRAISLLASHELVSQAKLHRLEARAIARASGRIPMLGSLAAAIAVLALGGLRGQALSWALTCMGVGMTGALVSQLFSRAAVRSSAKLSDLSQELSRRLEAHWAEAPPS